jgi:hypothetical protein
MARTARNDLREEQLIGRQELKEELQGIVNDIERLNRRLGKPGVTHGLFQAISTRDLFDREETFPNSHFFDEMGSRYLKQLPDILLGFHRDLRILSISASRSIKLLQLEGRIGPATTWHSHKLSAKVKFALVGDLLFQIVRHLKRRPDPKNKTLAEFLSYVWYAASNEQDVLDWTRSIRTARGVGSNEKDTDFANELARLEAFNLLSKLDPWQTAHRLRAKRDIIR